MGIAVLPKVDISVAAEGKNGKVVLLGNGGSTFDKRIISHEPLHNSHHMRSCGAIVYDKAKNFIGSQCFKVKDYNGELVKIPLAFNGYIMRAGLRTPTEEEFLALRAIWVMPPMEKVRTKINKQISNS